MSDNAEKQPPAPTSKDQAPKDDGSGSLSNSKETKSTKSTTSTSSFEDFSKYRRDVSKESLGKGQVPDATAKEREEIIKKLLEEQEKETARRQAEAENVIKSQSSSESIEVVTKRLQNLKKKKIQELKQSEQQQQQLQGKVAMADAAKGPADNEQK